jgi:hypothetical protein
MTSLAKKAMARKAKKEDDDDEVDPYEDCLKEAWDAMKGDDFKSFKVAFKAGCRLAVEDEE